MSRWLAATNLTKQCGISIFFVQFLFFLLFSVLNRRRRLPCSINYYIYSIESKYDLWIQTMYFETSSVLSTKSIEYTAYKFSLSIRLNWTFNSFDCKQNDMRFYNKFLREEYLCEHCKQHHWSSDNALSRPQRNNLNEDEFRKVAVDLVFEEC